MNAQLRTKNDRASLKRCAQASEPRTRVFHLPPSRVRRPSSVVCRQAPGFTLMELLVVISIIAILLGIIVPTYNSIREKAQYTKAKASVKNLETAFKAYLDQYRTWPATWNESDQEIDNNVVDILKGVASTYNKDKIVFYEFETTNSAGDALDSWSNPSDQNTWRAYHFRVDADYDNKIDGITRSVLVWSPGADRSNNTPDDVKSWD
ncbi:MAG: prepilin-type N-terminal cleavage/methylation domain-containing protein [Kiritimatiellae bacterium]|nr:prepilin-type N-terminal cleavage/methylation domain-containing protein [Kiritimatiellia bacterium]